MKTSVLSRISCREKEVLELVSMGLTSNEISSELFISNHTVMSHRKNIQAKLGAQNIAHVVRIAFENGLLHLPQKEVKYVFKSA